MSPVSGRPCKPPGHRKDAMIIGPGMAALPCCTRGQWRLGTAPRPGRSIHRAEHRPRGGIENSPAWCVADITNPSPAPLELRDGAGDLVPFRPIVKKARSRSLCYQDLWSKHRDWVFEPIHYSSVDALIASLDEKIIQPAEARFVEPLKRKADTMGGEHI